MFKKYHMFQKDQMTGNYKFTDFHCTAPQSFVERNISLGSLFCLREDFLREP